MANDKKKFENKDRSYNPYSEGQAVIDARSQANAANNAYNKHVNAGFTYSDQNWMNDVINSIKTRPDFQYDLNGDALYQQYKDKFIQQGKMAMADTMGQASAMTGGYGNSYAATAGNQAYQASLENLNDIVPQLYQMALDQYNQKTQDLYNQYGLASDQRNFEYGRWTDTANRLDSNRGYYQNAYNNERTYYRNVYDADRTYYTNQHWNETNYGYGQERDEKGDAREIAIEMIRGGLTPSKDVLEAAGISVEDAKAMAGAYASQNSGSSGDGDFHLANYRRRTDMGTVIFEINGKEVELEAGINPYTNNRNPDLKYGARHNGYQPDNVGGEKLTEVKGEQINVNGRNQKVWKTPDGKKWVWDGSQNRYVDYSTIKFED